ncbi:MAG: hypothetical protein A2Z97_01755 [Bdellovibrionales bacterium GWB1_52_6]|nr:MAG: hypothetical protein A2Z97_01755 [Bdellovibrionales bacterium GWB1_52_6]OFZ04926.1 MAG: hypothetical protein A2X97_16315 [Bdellovibrionales bacterium GWA1_52_35]
MFYRSLQSLNGRGLMLYGKVLCTFLLFISFAACQSNQTNMNHTIHILLREGPLNLDPRTALDATSQIFGSLIYRSLVRLDKDLRPVPELAESWTVSKDGLTWDFLLRAGFKDHQDQKIDPVRVHECLESYRKDHSRPSIIRAFTETWKSVSLKQNHLKIELSRPDPFLLNELVLLRYFRVPGASGACTGPQNSEQPLIGSGDYQVTTFTPSLEGVLRLKPVSGTRPVLEFHFVQDENTKVLKIIRGDIDAAYNALSHSKLQWLRENHTARFSVLERGGSAVSYLAFNLKNPILANSRVREAIAHALDRRTIAQSKIGGSLAQTLLPPSLPEALLGSDTQTTSYDPVLARKLLDKAGYPEQKNGIRFRLTFKTTPFRESLELAIIFQKMLREIGVELVIESVESAVFFASIRKGNFDLFTSRWVGVTNGSVLNRALHSQSTANRTGYRNPTVDGLLDRSSRELNEVRRAALFQAVQKIMLQDLPYLPLWYWNNTLILKNGITGLKAEDLYRSNSLEPLTRLQEIHKP